MSNIGDIVGSAQNGKLIDNLAERFGLSHEQMDQAVSALVPALSLALQKSMSNPDALKGMIEAIAHPAHHAAFDDPDHASAASIDSGSDIVAQLFGSNAAAGQIAQVASRQTGIRADILSQLLPMLAPIILGGLFKSMKGQGLGGILSQLAASGALTAILGKLLGGSAGAAPQPPAPGPSPAPGGLSGGLLGGLLGALLSVFLGGKRAAPAETANAPAPQSPGGFNPADLQSMLEKLKGALRPGSSYAPSQDAELQDILDKVFPRQK